MSEDEEIAGLLRTRLRLEDEVDEPNKQLKRVNDRLRELLRARGREFVDEELRLVAFIEERPRWSYDAQVLVDKFQDVAIREELLITAVDVAKLEALIDSGFFTRRQLQEAGVMAPAKLIPTLLVKPWKGGV